ncbi:MAG: hypothetical protein WED11_07055, partial [Natronospirillum sp.]
MNGKAWVSTENNHFVGAINASSEHLDMSSSFFPDAVSRQLLFMLLLACIVLAGHGHAEGVDEPGSPDNTNSTAAPTALENWQDVVRQSPYWVSQGVYRNLRTLRLWVLNNEAYCANEDRHILFDHRARFIGYLADGETREETQQRINQRRSEYAAAGRVDAWTPGGAGATGYPFALSCHQPNARLHESLARYSGEDVDARLWGTWDGMRLGEPDAPISLHDAIRLVYQDRVERGRITMPADVLSTLAGKTIIESGGLRLAHSAADARGIMQLSRAALNDCELAEQFHFHRM